MNDLKHYFPAGGKVEMDSEITQIKEIRANVYTGQAIFEGASQSEKVVIFSQELNEGIIDYRAVPAKCPHQGADISNDPVKADGNLYCSLHRRPICIYSEYNQAYLVEKREGRYFITAAKD